MRYRINTRIVTKKVRLVNDLRVFRRMLGQQSPFQANRKAVQPRDDTTTQKVVTTKATVKTATTIYTSPRLKR